MLQAADLEKFEQAAAIRDRLEQLNKINQKQIIFRKVATQGSWYSNE